MGQKIREDKITALNHSAGNITLASGAFLTIGGQQYKTSSQLLVALPTLASFQLYYVYATVSGGNPQLTISQNVNSVGPSGFSSWKLLGALYSDGTASPAFGSFVNIEGAPCSEAIDYIPVITNSGSHTLSYAKATRIGKLLRVDARFTSGAPASSPATLSLPSALNGISFSANHVLGNATPDNTTIDLTVIFAPGTSTQQVTFGLGNTGSTPATPTNANTTWSNGNGVRLYFEIPIAEWNTKALKDL